MAHDVMITPERRFHRCLDGDVVWSAATKRHECVPLRACTMSVTAFSTLISIERSRSWIHVLVCTCWHSLGQQSQLTPLPPAVGSGVRVLVRGWIR